MATVSLIMLADGIVVDFVAAEVEMLFGEEMMNSAVSMMFSFFFWEERDIVCISQPAFIQYSFL